MIRGRISLFAVAAAVALVAVACGGASGNGVASKSASAILAAAKAAGSGASGVKVTAVADVGGNQETYILQEQDGTHYTESLAVANGQRYTHLRIGTDVYLIGNPAYLAKQGASPARQKQLNDKWLMGTVAPTSTPPKLTQLMDTTLNPSGALTKGGTSTVDGQPVVAVIDAKAGGTLYVATSGTPYPVEVVKDSPSGTTSKVTFSDWNQRVPLTPPASYQSLSLLTGGS